MRGSGNQQGVQSVEVGARLLKAIGAASAPLMLKELAAAARMPPAKAHRYLVSLARCGLGLGRGIQSGQGIGGIAVGILVNLFTFYVSPEFNNTFLLCVILLTLTLLLWPGRLRAQPVPAEYAPAAPTTYLNWRESS